MRTLFFVVALLTPSLGFRAAALAHPVAENVLDVVIEPGRVVIDARISPEQIAVVEGPGAGLQSLEKQWPELERRHLAYVRRHIALGVDGVPVPCERAVLAEPGSSGNAGTGGAALIVYRLEYSMDHQPRTVEVRQDFLKGADGWASICLLRVRQSDQVAFETGQMAPDHAASFDCVWPDPLRSTVNAPADQVPQAGGEPIHSRVPAPPGLKEKAIHRLLNMRTGCAHLLLLPAFALAITIRRRQPC